MALPDIPLPTGSVVIEGTEVGIRAMSRSEVLRMKSFKGQEEGAEPFVVSCGTGVSGEEAAAWLDSVTLEAGGELIEAIFALSGLLDPREGSTGAGPDAQATSEPS